MTHINKEGYVQRRTYAGCKNANGRITERDWYLVKYAPVGMVSIGIGNVHVPARYRGKKIRFKVELLPDDMQSQEEEL